MPIYGRFSAPYILHFLLYIIKEFCLVGTCRKAQLVRNLCFFFLFPFFLCERDVGMPSNFVDKCFNVTAV